MRSKKVDNMPNQITKLILPFAVPAKDRAKAFTKDMEIAAIFYLAESDREKGGGRIFKKPGEELVFIAEACYPVWLVPWRERTLFFDGLGVTMHALRYDILPDAKAFDTNLQESAKTREAYSAALSHNANYFQAFADKEEKTLEGLITSPDFVKDFVFLLPEAEESDKPLVDRAFLSSAIDESAISASLEELSNFRAKLRKDVSDLSESMKMLSATTKGHVKVIREEVRAIEKKFDEEIAKIKPPIMERVNEIERKCHVEITKVSKNFDRQLQLLYKDRVKLEKKRERVNLQIDRYEAEIKSCRLREDEGGELGWRQKLEKTKKELPALQRDIQDLNKKIGDAETAKSLEIAKLRSECDASIEEATKDLRELEASREAGIRMKQQEIKSLEDMTSAIISQMNEKATLKKAALKELEEMGAPKSREEYALVCLPFYFACYETKTKKRYVVYSPSIVGSMGILTKLKGAFGATKMKSFLQPRSKAISALLNQLVTLTQENPVFEKEISDAGIKASILQTTELRTSVKTGLKELRDEKWISESELQTFSKLL